MNTVRVDTSGGVTRIRLHRPEVRNALDDAMMAELGQCFLALPAPTRVVVLAGEGAAFCAGADAQWMKRSKSFTREENERDAAALASLLRAVDECPCPVVARVQGAAMGGALGLIAACDTAVAEEGTQFGFPEVRLGIVPAVISPWVLPRIGIAAARRYFLTGERFDAREARELGLIHEVAPAGSLDARVDGVVHDLLAGGPLAIRAAKGLIRQVGALSRDPAIEHAVREIARIRISPEAQEGLSAFLEKRKPSWP